MTRHEEVWELLQMSAAEWTREATTSSGLGVYFEPVASGMAASLTENLPEELAGLGGQD